MKKNIDELLGQMQLEIEDEKKAPLDSNYSQKNAEERKSPKTRKKYNKKSQKTNLTVRVQALITEEEKEELQALKGKLTESKAIRQALLFWFAEQKRKN